MGRRKNNPDLVEELIDNIWSMPQDEFEKKYFSLSSSDQLKVGEAIDNMDSAYDHVPEGCAACGNPAYPNCMDSCSFYDE